MSLASALLLLAVVAACAVGLAVCWRDGSLRVMSDDRTDLRRIEAERRRLRALGRCRR